MPTAQVTIPICLQSRYQGRHHVKQALAMPLLERCLLLNRSGLQITILHLAPQIQAVSIMLWVMIAHHKQARLILMETPHTQVDILPDCLLRSAEERMMSKIDLEVVNMTTTMPNDARWALRRRSGCPFNRLHTCKPSKLVANDETFSMSQQEKLFNIVIPLPTTKDSRSLMALLPT